jgi:hypothetical protein
VQDRNARRLESCRPAEGSKDQIRTHPFPTEVGGDFRREARRRVGNMWIIASINSFSLWTMEQSVLVKWHCQGYRAVPIVTTLGCACQR